MPPVECPVDAEARRWLDERWTWLEQQFGKQRPWFTEVLLPREEYFPDAYTGTPEDAQLIFDRVCDYMSIDPATIELHFYVDQYQTTSGAYTDHDGQYRVWLESGNLNDPLALVATMAHELCHILLLGQGRIASEEEDHEPLTDLLTVFLGMGIFTANAVIRENYWQAGYEAGWKMSRGGYLTMPMFGYALALFARARGDDEARDWVSHLRGDVRSAYNSAMQFLDAAEEDHVYPAPVASALNLAQMTDMPVDEPDERIAASMISVGELLDRYAAGERDFRSIDLHDACLCDVDLSEIILARADLNGADLTNAILNDADLRGADLEGAILQNAELQGADLRDANCTDADLADVDLTGADIRGANFTGAKLHGADFSEAQGALTHDDRVGQVFSVLVFACMAGLLGAIPGCVVGGAIEEASGLPGLAGIGQVAGFILAATLVARRLRSGGSL